MVGSNQENKIGICRLSTKNAVFRKTSKD